ncbi:MAG: diguanylate cyclase [Gammaproteobacteria bacterium]
MNRPAPDKRSPLPPGSLRARFVLGLAAMLLPPLLLSAGAFLSLQATTGAAQKVLEKAIRGFNPVAHTGTLLLMAAMPPNDYLIHGEPSEREDFARLSRNVDQSFQESLAEPFALAEERELLLAAQQEWRQARALADHLLALPDPAGNPDAARDMERMDAHIDRAANTLAQVLDVIRRGMDQALAEARATRQRLMLLIAGAFVLGLLITIGGTLLLTRSVLAPLRSLEEGASRFGAGDLSHRVDSGRMPEEVGHLAQVFNAMAERLKEKRTALEALATHDGLTGLYNHRTFYTLLQEELARATRFKRPVSLLMLDIDHFKRVNDMHGHQAGDVIIRGLSELLLRRAREIDRVCRYGGEEIMMILPETGMESAAVIAERLRAAVEAQSFDVNRGAPVHITVSIDIASWPEAHSAQALVAAADRALYAAKNAGRNRVSQAPGADGRAAAC